jgi:hypothetical protein
MAERATIGDAHAIDVPDGADPAVAAGSGSQGSQGGCRSPGERRWKGEENVLVLGATGSVGFVAVQTAKLLGAARVVAAGRSSVQASSELTQHGADATLAWMKSTISSPPSRTLRRRGPELHLRSPVGASLRPAAVQAAVPHARSSISVSRWRDLRARVCGGALQDLSILGHTNFLCPPDELAKQYRRLVTHGVAESTSSSTIERVASRNRSPTLAPAGEGAGAKLVVVP